MSIPGASRAGPWPPSPRRSWTVVSASGGQGVCSPLSVCPRGPHEASLGGPHRVPAAESVSVVSVGNYLVINVCFIVRFPCKKKNSNMKCIRFSVAPSNPLPLEAAAAGRRGPWRERATPGGGLGAAGWELAASFVWIWAVATRGGRGWVRPADSPVCCLQARDPSPQTTVRPYRAESPIFVNAEELSSSA